MTREYMRYNGIRTSIVNIFAFCPQSNNPAFANNVTGLNVFFFKRNAAVIALRSIERMTDRQTGRYQNIRDEFRHRKELIVKDFIGDVNS